MNNFVKAIICVFVMICPAGKAFAFDMFGYIDIRSSSMGRTFAAVCSPGNPSSYSFAGKSVLSIDYINRFGMKELSSYSAFANIDNRIVNTGVYLSRFGMDSYNENKFSLYFHRQLSRYISIGIRINYLFWQMHYQKNNVHAVTADVGMSIKPLDKLMIGIVINNPVKKGIIKGKSIDKLPVMIAVGVSYKPVSDLLLTCEVEKNLSEEIYYKFGTEYKPIPELAIRLGVCALPLIPTFGVGVEFKDFMLNLGAKYHNTLGLEYLCGLSYSF